MTSVNILKFGTTSPADTSPLRKLKEAGYDAKDIIGIVGKSEGNGCVNDFSRTLSTAAWEPLIPSSAITIFSGGTEGVLSPHVTFIVSQTSTSSTSSTPNTRNKPETGLYAAVGSTRDFLPQEIGTSIQASTVNQTISTLLSENNISREDVHMVLIKCPLLTSSKIAEIKTTTGKEAITNDTYESMALSRYASAIGIGTALGELPIESCETFSSSKEHYYSSKASCSSGAELESCHILILSSPPNTNHKLRMLSTQMNDAMDAPSILKALEKIKSENGEIVQVFAKAEADPQGQVRGFRHTMNTDSDLHSTRHARAAVGGLLAGLTGDAQIYVSGGAEGQGPVGGGPLAVVYRVP